MKQTPPSASLLVYGIHPILEIIRAKKRKIYTLYVTERNNKNINSIIKQIPSYTTVHYVTKSKLDHLVNTQDHQGIVASVGPHIYRKSFFSTATHPLIIIIDRIHDPRNLGAIIRSAYCTNTMGIVITESHSSPLTATALKASAGLAEHVDIFLAKNIMEALILAKNNGYAVYSAAFGGKNLYYIHPEKYSCIIVGNEEKGIEKKALLETTIISIPQKEDSISFNVSVASGIIMSYFSYSLSRDIL